MCILTSVTHKYLVQIQIVSTFIANGSPFWAEQKFLQERQTKLLASLLSVSLLLNLLICSPTPILFIFTWACTAERQRETMHKRIIRSIFASQFVFGVAILPALTPSFIGVPSHCSEIIPMIISGKLHGYCYLFVSEFNPQISLILS